MVIFFIYLTFNCLPTRLLVQRVLNPCFKPMRVTADGNFRFYAVMLLCLFLCLDLDFYLPGLCIYSPPSKNDRDE